MIIFKVFISSSIIGMINEISKSKIKNIIEIMKNWFEKGFRLIDIWLNPHSNLVIFSCWFSWVYPIIEKIMGKVWIIKNEIVKDKIKFIISFKLFFNWKLNVFFILKNYFPHQ
jgi:hypothetical protein